MAPPSPDVTRRLLHDQIERLWGAGEIGLVRRNYAPDIVDHMPVPGQTPGLDGMEEVVRGFRAAMPDLRMELHGTIVSGGRGCDWWTLTGTNTGPLFGREPTGARVEMSGIDMVRVADGRIAEIWHVEEMLRFEDALGVAPAPIAEAAPAPDGPGGEPWTPDPASLAERGRRTLAAVRAWRPAAPDPLSASASDLRVELGAVLVEGDLAAVRWTAAGTRTGLASPGVAARGRRFRVAGMDVLRVRDDGTVDPVLQVAELARLRAQPRDQAISEVMRP